MQIAKWGNSFAIRIPADVMRELGAELGDDVTVRVAADGALELMTEADRRRRAIAAIERLSRPFPPDFKFDREEANAR